MSRTPPLFTSSDHACGALALNQFQTQNNPFFVYHHLPTFTPDRRPYFVEFASQTEVETSPLEISLCLDCELRTQS